MVKPLLHRLKWHNFSDKKYLPNKRCVPGNTAWQRETGTIKIAHWTILFWKRNKGLQNTASIHQHFLHIHRKPSLSIFPSSFFLLHFPSSNKEGHGKLHLDLQKEPKRHSQRQDFAGECCTGTFIGSHAWQKVSHICRELSQSVRGKTKNHVSSFRTYQARNTMALVQLSDIREIQFEPHKSPWQVRHCHD